MNAKISLRVVIALAGTCLAIAAHGQNLGGTIVVTNRCGCPVTATGTCVNAAEPGSPLLPDICEPGLANLVDKTIRDATREINAAGNGRWRVSLKPMHVEDADWMTADTPARVKSQIPLPGSPFPIDEVYVSLAPTLSQELRGMKFGVARDLLKQRFYGTQLRLWQHQRAMPPAVLENATIVDRAIGPGTAIPRSGILVTVALPVVDDLLGKTVKHARELLQKSRSDARLHRWPDAAPLKDDDVITSQFPGNGEVIPVDGIVRVSFPEVAPSPEPQCAVPARKGQGVVQANTPNGARCRVEERSVPTDKYALDSVIGVTPMAGLAVPAGSTIQILVASKPEVVPARIPPPLGKCLLRISDARPILAAAGYTIAKSAGQAKPMESDWIIGQSPEGGSRPNADAPASVILKTVAEGAQECTKSIPQPVKVPLVETREVTEAIAALRAADLYPTGWAGGALPFTGNVIAQRPAANENVARGTKVELWFSSVAGCAPNCTPPEPKKPVDPKFVLATLGSGLAFGYAAAQMLRPRRPDTSGDDDPPPTIVNTSTISTLPPGLSFRTVGDPPIFP